MKLQTDDIESYLREMEILDYGSEPVAGHASGLVEGICCNINKIRIIFEFVRDKISHSIDTNRDAVTCKASEVLAAGHVICFAKSHLLVASVGCRGRGTVKQQVGNRLDRQ